MKTIEKVHDDNFGLSVKHDDIVADSRMVAERFGKSHKHVLRDIEKIIERLKKFDSPILGSRNSKSADKDFCLLESEKNMFYKGYYFNAQNHRQPLYYMTRDGFSMLVMGFTGDKAFEWKLKYNRAFNEMEKAVAFRRSDIEKQKSDMDNLNAKNGSIDYIKANTIANKAVSTLFGFPKSVKKEAMTDDMLNVRSEVMNDIINLMNAKEFLPADFKISEAVYNKWNP